MILENTPTIETERLILRRFTEDDISDMFMLYGDEEVNKFLPWFVHKTFLDTKAYLYDNIFACYQKEVGYSYAIALKSNDAVIGYIHVHDMGKSNDFGYALRKEFWGKGIMSEAASVVIERLKYAGYSHITATHDVLNSRSGEVMKRLGMTYKYSYIEQWQPKDILVTFRMYQLNFDGNTDYTYMEYWDKYQNGFIEKNL